MNNLGDEEALCRAGTFDCKVEADSSETAYDYWSLFMQKLGHWFNHLVTPFSRSFAAMFMRNLVSCCLNCDSPPTGSSARQWGQQSVWWVMIQTHPRILLWRSTHLVYLSLSLSEELMNSCSHVVHCNPKDWQVKVLYATTIAFLSRRLELSSGQFSPIRFGASVCLLDLA